MINNQIKKYIKSALRGTAMTSATEFIDEPDTIRNETIDNGLLVTDNRTTELREKLTERGVKWRDESNGYVTITTFTVNGVEWNAIAKHYIGSEHDWMKLRSDTNVTPEQAIAATLGGGECEQVITDCDDGLMPPFTAHCSKCGVEWGFTPKFCPECGAKVVGMCKRQRTNDKKS